MSKIKLSIIIPVFNLESYVAQTLNSCLDQKVDKNLYEIVVVDDGSKDKTLEVVKGVAQKYENVKVFNKENGGVSSARNFGLEKALGDYVWFIDGDDLISPNCLEYIFSVIDANPDVEVFAMCSDTFETTPNFQTISSLNAELLSGKELKNKVYHLCGSICDDVYKKSVLIDNGVCFSKNIAYSEDVLFAYKVLINSKKCLRSSAVIYYYRQRQGSAMHSYNLKKFTTSMFNLAEEYDEIYKNKKFERYKKVSKDKRDFSVKALLFFLCRQGDVDGVKDAIKQLKERKFYPYPIKFKTLFKNETKKQFLINLASLLLPLKWYAVMFAKRMKRQKGGKK